MNLSDGDSPVYPDHRVELLLDPGLDPGVPHHVEHGPGQRGGGGLRARQEEVKQVHLETGVNIFCSMFPHFGRILTLP